MLLRCTPKKDIQAGNVALLPAGGNGKSWTVLFSNIPMTKHGKDVYTVIGVHSSSSQL